MIQKITSLKKTLITIAMSSHNLFTGLAVSLSLTLNLKCLIFWTKRELLPLPTYLRPRILTKMAGIQPKVISLIRNILLVRVKMLVLWYLNRRNKASTNFKSALKLFEADLPPAQTKDKIVCPKEGDLRNLLTTIAVTLKPLLFLRLKKILLSL